MNRIAIAGVSEELSELQKNYVKYGWASIISYMV
jgi:hypothetical protein